MAVLLPAPLGPISPVIWPSAAVNEQALTACTPPKCLLSSWTSSSAVMSPREPKAGAVTGCSTCSSSAAMAAPPFPDASLSRMRRSGRMPCGRKRMKSTRTMPVRISRNAGAKLAWPATSGRKRVASCSPMYMTSDAEQDAARAAAAADQDRGVQRDRLHRATTPRC